MPTPLVAIDLDGTLLTEDSRLTAGHEEFLYVLRKPENRFARIL